MDLTVLHNDATVPAGHLGRIASSRGINVHEVRLDAGDHLPNPAGVEAVVVLGGAMGVYDTDAYSYLVPEMQFLRDAVAMERPVLGICLGCQLLAQALGGSAYRSEAPEYHVGAIATIDDAVVGTLSAGPSLSFHRDTWDLPPGAELVGRTDGFNHAFRKGSALGVQSHPELTQSTLNVWLTDPGFASMAKAANTDTTTIAADFLAVASKASVVADHFFNAWLDEVDG
jgi:GMP synthase (glutamine-hydrolysing)